jgi:putative nucleotidyltransferase with HDIG domain
MNNTVSTDELLARIERLPALPRAVHELNEALSRADVPTDRIVRAVGSDQALTVSALRLANSSFYGVSGRVVNLRDAVQILGLQTLTAAVLTSAVMARFDRTACPGFDFDACWRHALATALCAQALAQPRGIDACTAYTAGLLHDIGRLALASCFPRQLTAAQAWAAEHDIAPQDAERAVLGSDHAVVGSLIAAHWRLAPAIVDAIRLHHEVPAGAGRSVLDVLHLADNIVHALDVTHEPDDMVPTLSLGVWERLGVSVGELQQVFAQIEQRMSGFDVGSLA